MPMPKMISPLMDKMITGDAISDHNGIRCYPAMNQETNQKYILKIISVPSSQTQLEALLLTGALENEDAARKYFEDRVNEIVRELDILQQLSRQEGFLPYEGYQVVSNEDSVGFDIYILTSYKRSLERQFKKKPLSQLDALNLGLDICSALTASRRSGYLFVNLKPNNIYVGNNGEYRIADLGLVSLNELKYAILSEHYIGDYSPPELSDPFSPLNETIDTYALGRILYQIYNDGVLPEKDKADIPAPQYADEELSQIILKAISSNPDDRWQDPAQMGQMLVSYMQKNGVEDVPIIPPAPEPAEEEPEASREDENLQNNVGQDVPDAQENSDSIDAILSIVDELIAPEEEAEATASPPEAKDDEAIPQTEKAENTAPALEEADSAIQPEEPSPTEIEQLSIEESSPTENEQLSIEELLSGTEDPPQDTQIPEDPSPSTAFSEPDSQEGACEPPSDTQTAETIDSQDDSSNTDPYIIADSKDAPDETPPLPVTKREDASEDDENDTPEDESPPESETTNEEHESYCETKDLEPLVVTEYDGISDEVSQMLSQADALAALNVPDPVVAPQPVEIAAPEPIIEKDSVPPPDNQPNNTEDRSDMKTDEFFTDDYFDDEAPKKRSHWLRNTIIIVALLLLLLGGFMFYKKCVQKTVAKFEHTISGNTLTVYVTSDAPEDKLYVSCSDGSITSTGKVQGGKVVFNSLQPNTTYTITLDVSGLYVLKGYQPITFETLDAVKLKDSQVEVGSTSGTVNIKFKVEGGESERWSFTYDAPGIAPKTVPVEGTSFTLTGLRENISYKGILTPEKDLLISEPLEIVFSASELIEAKDLRIVSCSGGSMKIQWNAPENTAVESWFARCYNENYDETLSDLKTTSATFSGLNSTESFTVEVWAKNQTARQRIRLEDNSITVRNISAELIKTGRITLNWKSSSVPQGGWIVSYTVNNSKKVFTTNTTETSLVINPALPGAKYTFSIKAADNSVTTFCDDYICNVPPAESKFSMIINEDTINAQDIHVDICRRPRTGGWTYADLSANHYTQSFSAGETAALLFYLKDQFQDAPETLNIIVAVTDEDGGLYSISSHATSWGTMWNQNYYSLNITDTPKDIGCYTAAVYINNMYLTEFDFAVS